MVQISNDRLSRRATSRRQEILRAAARVFRRRGFHAAGMRDIAEEADLSPGNLYHYFRGKQELLYYCQNRALDTMLEALDRAGSGQGPVRERLENVLTNHVHCILDDLEGASAHLALDDLPPDLRSALVKKRDRYERGVRILVEEGKQRGEFSVPDAGIITRAIFGSMNWTVQWFDPSGALSAEEVAKIITGYLIRGLSGRVKG